MNLSVMQIALLTVFLFCLIYRLYRFFSERLGAEKIHAQAMAALHLRTIEALALAIKAKSHTSHEHLNRVQVYATELARDLRLSQNEIDAIQTASLLHDIGNLAIPEHIIAKPGKLTPEEFDKMKTHPSVGASILERVGFPYPVVPIVESHHERWDGKGYPNGMSGTDIPIGARILAAVDCLDALSSDRQYRKALPLNQAMAVVRNDAGKAFDPAIVDLLELRYQELELKTKTCAVKSAVLPGAGDTTVQFDSPAGCVERSAASASTASAEPAFLQSIAAARDEAQALFQLSEAIGSASDLNDTLGVVAQGIRNLVDSDGIAIWLLQDDTFRPAYISSRDQERFTVPQIQMDGLLGQVTATSDHGLNDGRSDEAGYREDGTWLSTMQSALSAPLNGVAGRIGVLTLYRTGRDSFNSEDSRILNTITSKVGISIENALRLQAATTDAETDHLTGLPNGKALFLHLKEQVAHCGRTNVRLSVLVCDLDGFKQVNDTFGHLEGNEVLKAVAQTIQRHCREQDYVARLGGDEFVIVLPEIDADEVEPIACRIETAVAETSCNLYGDLLFRASVGAASLSAQTCTADALLSEADKQMYEAKRARKRKARTRASISMPDSACSLHLALLPRTLHNNGGDPEFSTLSARARRSGATERC